MYKEKGRRRNMDDEYPLSRQTTERAVKLCECAEKIGMGEPIAAMDYKRHGDVLIYIFATNKSMAIVYVSPNCYLVTHGDKDHMTQGEADYYMVANIRTFLQKLRKLGYEPLTRDEMNELQERAKSLLSEREPSDDDLEEIEDEEDDEEYDDD